MTLERVVQTEQRLSVELKSLWAVVDEDGYLTANGEVVAVGNGPQDNFTVVLTAYDAQDRIVYTSDNIVFIDEFVGFETFSFFSQVGPVARVRLHVKPA